MKVRRGRRCKQLLDDFKDARRYWKLKEKALDRTVWRTGFGRGYGLAYRNPDCVVMILDNLFLITKHFSPNVNSLGQDKEVQKVYIYINKLMYYFIENTASLL